MAKSPEELAHIEWLGYVQPVGLVVSIPAMLEAQCYVNKNIMGEHARFLDCLVLDDTGVTQPEVRDLREFVQAVLGWEPDDLVDVPARQVLGGDMAKLEVVLPQYNETLRPTHAVPVFRPEDDQNPWLLLIQELPADTDLDEAGETDSSRHWNASPQAKFERLLRETGVPIGLLSNRRSFRLVYSPRGETSGYATFNVDEMAQVAGRPMFAALHMLLSSERMFSMGDNQRLPAILSNSRKYQNTVSTELAEQVLAALYELMRGFQAANDVRKGELLSGVLARDPNQVYSGLLTVLMRLVFILYAEDRDLLSSDPIYSNHYSVTGLFNRLREDDGRFPDTMDQRFGAWSQLVTLFRLVYEGGQHNDFKLPARKGYLFDPERYAFLEGRVESGEWSVSRNVPNQENRENGSAELSGSGSLAKGDGSVGGVLSSDEDLSEGGAIRNDQPDTPGSGIDSSEYRRGTGSQGNQRVSELLGDREGFTDGSGNTPDPLRESRLAANQRAGAASSIDGPNQSHAHGPEKGAGATSGEWRVKSEVGVESEEWRVEGKRQHSTRSTQNPSPTTHHTPPTVPRVSDGTVFRVLKNLLILDGERLSYRTLDVEQIGSVYETVMGFNLQVAAGKSIAIKPVKSHGAPATINLDELLETPGKDRAKWLKDNADQKVGAADAKLLKAATNLEELLTALDRKIAKKVTPRVVPAGAIVLQPSDERRRSGSHYTPRSLTEPIVRTTLEPILKQLIGNPENTSPTRKRVTEPSNSSEDHSLALRARMPEVYKPTAEDKRRYTKGELDARVRLSQKAVEHARGARKVGTPHPSQILDLKVCDPAMGSGAFLVEACRQLGDELIKAWYAHDAVPSDIPPDEDEVLYARRLVAQRCLYGVDKNFMAVDLAKLALWLVTLAKDHAFTFLDHSLRHGDSLVGLSREQIIGFHWEPKKQKKFGEELIQRRLDRATEARAKILNTREGVSYRDQEQKMALADEALSGIRLLGDACVSAFFAGKKKKEREDRVGQLFDIAAAYLEKLKDGKLDHELRKSLETAAKSLQEGEHPIPAFHWEIEFPEVFARDNGGFDAFVGNPPFAGKNNLIGSNHDGYLDWLKETHEESHGNSDLVAHFFRRAFMAVRKNGTLGLIATKTIRQGDTRHTGLRWICTNGGSVYSASRRMTWPGMAAVVVSVVHIVRGQVTNGVLDGRPTGRISAYLFHRGGHENPITLRENESQSFIGNYINGAGFTFDDTTANATPIAEMEELLVKHPECETLIHPYLGGEEMLNVPQHLHHRYVINFGERTEDEAREWPPLFDIVERNVKPHRLKQSDKASRTYWWQFARKCNSLHAAAEGLTQLLVHPNLSSHLAFTFIPRGVIVGAPHNVLIFDTFDAFAILQSSVHEVWARFFSSTLKDDLPYTPSDCFETFAMPTNWRGDRQLAQVGHDYFDFRASLLLKDATGLTKTYNRFHDSDERDAGILKLRELHDEMDRAVLRAYGWNDLADTATCEFLLDYEEEEDEQSGAKKSKKKKPWRYRWPDEFRDEVLARLLELNEQRHQEELLLAKQTKEGEKGSGGGREDSGKSRKRGGNSDSGQPTLGFGGYDE